MRKIDLFDGHVTLRAVLASSFLFFGSIVSAAPAGTQTPSPLIGTWDVSEVLIDATLGPLRSPVFRDDLHILGRELIVEPNKMRMNYADGNCVPKRWRIQRTTWATLIARYQLRKPGDRVRPNDYELAVTASDRIRSFRPECSMEGRTDADNAPWNRFAWLALKDKNTLVLSFDASSLLVLSRRQESAKPDPSFPCETAQSDAEKAICSSVALSSLDRNLYKIWKIRGRNRYKEKSGIYTKDDVEDMNKYVEERNSCGTNVECIEEKIQSYLDGMLYR